MSPPVRSLNECPLAQTASILCDLWTPLIVRDLVRGPKRFTELQRSVIGISPKTLSARLKQLERQGVVRRIAGTSPSRPRYELTPKGEALVPLIRDMRAYGRTWLIGESTRTAPDVRAQSVAAP